MVRWVDRRATSTFCSRYSRTSSSNGVRTTFSFSICTHLNIAQAVLGAEVEVPTVDGSEKLKIPVGTQPGKIFTLKARGVPHLRRSGRGDQLVIINVDIPVKLSKEQKELFEKLAATLGTTVKPKDKGFLIGLMKPWEATKSELA